MTHEILCDVPSHRGRVLPDKLTPQLVDVLGRPNFTCARIAELLRRGGEDIPRKAEAEQAHAIFWLLGFVLEHGEAWMRYADADCAKRMAALS